MEEMKPEHTDNVADHTETLPFSFLFHIRIAGPSSSFPVILTRSQPLLRAHFAPHSSIVEIL